MIISDYKQFISQLTTEHILALDVSKNRIGVAVASIKLKIALPVTTIKRSKFIQDANQIIQLFTEHNCSGLVIGYPINPLTQNAGKQGQIIKSFCSALLSYLTTPIYLEDEQFSTYAIKDFYTTHKINSHKPLDDQAASFFLQTFLNRLVSKNIN